MSMTSNPPTFKKGNPRKSDVITVPHKPVSSTAITVIIYDFKEMQK